MGTDWYTGQNFKKKKKRGQLETRSRPQHVFAPVQVKTALISIEGGVRVPHWATLSPQARGPRGGPHAKEARSPELWRLTQTSPPPTPCPSTAGVCEQWACFGRECPRHSCWTVQGGESFWSGGLGGNENSPGEQRGEFCAVICYGKKEKTGTEGERESVCVCVRVHARTQVVKQSLPI